MPCTKQTNKRAKEQSHEPISNEDLKESESKVELKVSASRKNSHQELATV